MTGTVRLWQMAIAVFGGVLLGRYLWPRIGMWLGIGIGLLLTVLIHLIFYYSNRLRQ